jgi:catechol 2,3-dioxygenase-like lactoylglutathione lyase family enzyme
MTLRRINFQSIPVEDQDRALAFYRDVLGMQVQTDAADGAGGRWIFMRIPGAATLLHFACAAPPGPRDGPALWLVCDDVDAEAARLGGLGITLRAAPQDAPWHPAVRFATFDDSEGNLLFLQSSSLEGV